MTFTKAKHLVDAVRCSRLNHYYLASLWANFTLVSWIKKFSIPSITRTSFGISTSIGTCAEISSFYSTFILFNVFIVRNVFCDVLFLVKQKITYYPLFVSVASFIRCGFIDLIGPCDSYNVQSCLNVL